jgi:hypothetical protein
MERLARHPTIRRAKHINDESDIHKGRPGGDECEIADLQLIRSRGGETSLNPIQRLLLQIVWQ